MCRRRSLDLLTCILSCLLAGGAVLAQAAPGCDKQRSHEFDFWIGEWEVHANGQVAGTNSIQPILDGCVLQETWSGKGGSAGSSFNFYNPTTKQWEQFWVWRAGATLHLQGAYADGKMVLEGESANQAGKKVLNRISWHDNEDGTVRQHWEQSADGGQTWATSFDGLYRRKE